MSISGRIHDVSIRTIILEYYRICNHAPAITTNAIDTGSFTTMLRTREEREKLINFCESISGNRIHAASSFIGRLRHDTSHRRIDSFIY